MPQISKIRIVNFQYNDGKRLIADELFDFERGSKGPADVLINLANGGGKSVLVQLIMQPVIPKAKVAGRRIESFFTKATDHCFVALEWSLDDGSKRKLMTGIAMAASDATGDSDTERGFQIKYYTFLSLYSDYKGSCNIITLPLSKKEDGKFVPATFDEVRSLARKAGSELERFSSDDSVKWREKLAEYGIYQNEWRIIEALNSNEDGLSKYFSTRKTSDAVIDQLILPRIEENQRRTASADDSSLETMLISYSEQFSRQKDIIRERDTLIGFSDSLKEAGSQTEKLWSDNDAFEKSIETLFGFNDALIGEISRKEADIEASRAEQTRLREEITRINWEKVSAEYYATYKALQEEAERFRSAEAARQSAEARLSTAEKRLKLLECARYYHELRDLEDKLAAVKAEITNRETRSESTIMLAELKYSALCAIESALHELAPQLTGLSTDKDTVETEIRTLEEEIRTLTGDIESAASAVGKVEGIRDKQVTDNDVLVDKLGIDTFRLLSGGYPPEDLQNWRLESEKQAGAVEEAIASVRSEIASKEERKEAIPQEIADVTRNADGLRTALQELDERLHAFRSCEESVRMICERLSLDFSLRFTYQHRKYIAEQIAMVTASISAEEQKQAAVEEAIAAVKRGTLHIPKALLDFLDSTGIDYISFEKYLLLQQRNGLLTKEQVSGLLEKYPYAAYGIKIDDASLPAILKEAEDRWLPAVLPLFTNTAVARIMQGDADSVLSIAAYSQDYFSDVESYAGSLESQMSAIADRIAQLYERRKTLQAAENTLTDFSVYEETWLERVESERAKTETAIAAADSKASALKSELADVKLALTAANNQVETLRKRQGEIHDKLSTFERLLAGLLEEDRLTEELSKRRRVLDEAKSQKAEHEDEKVRKEKEISSISERLTELTSIQTELEKGREEVSGAPEAEKVPGDWESLLRRYRELLARQSEDLERLTKDRDQFYKDLERVRKELDRRACKPEEYAQLFFSDELEEAAAAEILKANAALTAARDEYDTRNSSHAKAAAFFARAEAGLSEHGGTPLPLEQIGSAFDKRIDEAEEKLRLTEAHNRAVSELLSALERIQGKAESAAEQYTRPLKVTALALPEDCEAQLNTLTKKIRELAQCVDSSKRALKDSLQKILAAYGSSSLEVRKAIDGMLELLENGTILGDRYYTILDHIDNAIHSAGLRISQIETDLGEFNKTKGDLIRHCVIQGKLMYEGLLQLSGGSKVRVQEKRCQMIKFDIPEKVDENVATTAITAEVEKGAEEIAAQLSSKAFSEAEIRGFASRIVGSKHLLRKYIGAESIVLKAYKIDSNPANSGYRTWEETQINNSGAEKFVVYFAVILALMTYAREDLYGSGSSGSRSVLVLDNPFGPISSKHVLEPMFEISRNYHVQMICLSDISKSDIVSCFDYVIRAIVKPVALSSKEQLTHEGNEMIEHGFYRSEQMKL